MFQPGLQFQQIGGNWGPHWTGGFGAGAGAADPRSNSDAETNGGKPHSDTNTGKPHPTVVN